MRWERLFAELEGAAVEAEQVERDALAAELREGEWAETSWVRTLGQQVALDVMVLGRVEGRTVLANAEVVNLSSERADLLIATSAVLAVLDSRGRRRAHSAVENELSWRHYLRAIRLDGGSVSCVRRDGRRLTGDIETVGSDFVRLGGAGSGSIAVPFAALAVAAVNRY